MHRYLVAYADRLLENARPPDAVTIHRSISERTAWYAGQYKESIRHSIEGEHVRYLGDLKTTLRAMQRALSDARPHGHSSPLQ